jgi:cobalamin biosynthesis Mg chelatase CobN
MEEIEKRLDEKTAKLQELEANRLLAGTAGGHIEAKPAQEPTAKEYAAAVLAGKVPVKQNDN